jgi:2-methylcitrate dehydratase PrpD
MSGGLLAFLADGGWSKWLHTGCSAHGGIVAAELARGSFRGPHHALDHPYGLYGAFLGAPTADLESVTTDLGKTWIGAGARAKSFPCAHVIQPYIEAVLAFRTEARLKADDVQSITCVLAPWALPIVATPRANKIAPSNDLEAIASLPFMVAAALCDGRVDLNTLQPKTLQRADILALAKQTDCVADDKLGAGFDGRIDVEIRDGRRLSRAVALSDPTEERIVTKFRANTAHLSPSARDALEHAVLNDAPGGRALIQLALAAIAQPSAAQAR